MQTIPETDRIILRELGGRKADIGHLPVQRETAALWRKLNACEPVRPLVWINEIPWHEIEQSHPELRLMCTHPLAVGVERSMRRELYQWEHFRGDMIVEPVVYSGIVGGPSSSYADYGVKEKLIRHDGGHDVGYEPVIHTEADADAIRTPKVWFDEDATGTNHRMLAEVFDGILPVRKRGIVHQWHSPWDQIIHWYGIEQLYTDMYERPALVHRLLGNFTAALTEVLDRQEALGMLDTGNGNYRIGSGGLGLSNELPDSSCAGKVTAKSQWGCSTAQIFSEVSPAMHEEFALQYEIPLMSRFGLTYYGCCEPLHRKIDILKKISNLRKISMSPWVNVDEAAERVGRDYVYSMKPSPALLATDVFDAEAVRMDLSEKLTKTKKCAVEVILKDITTIRGEADRLDAWEKIASQVVRQME
ncbi:MAG: hypothetical protein HZC28_19355 [Spirochaetes bacterium]|nr:hypothetical protein [Spirochaetota bacterium]